MKDNSVLELLIEHSESFLSGEVIGASLHMTRANVWKEVDKLRKQGYHIESVRNRGYRLVSLHNNLSAAAITQYLNPDLLQSVTVLDAVNSTNTYAKEALDDSFNDAFLIVSDHQTQGRGRRGRTFYSPARNGIYMSLAFVPNLSVEDTQMVTIIAAIAVKRALSDLYHIDVDIKWLNDIYINGKKLAGILTEGEIILESNSYRYLILGIGLNVYQDYNLPDSLASIYTSLDQHLQTDIDRNKLVAYITESFIDLYHHFPSNRTQIINEYRKSCFVIHQFIHINQDFSKRYYVTDIDERGQLIVIDDEQKQHTLNSGEISIQGAQK